MNREDSPSKTRQVQPTAVSYGQIIEYIQGSFLPPPSETQTDLDRQAVSGFLHLSSNSLNSISMADERAQV
jgi:hypothetical protein